VAGRRTSSTHGTDARRRVAIEAVTPQVDRGRFAAKRCVGDEVVVEADVFADGHEEVVAALLHRSAADATWCEAPMRPLGNDRWQGAFTVSSLEPYRFTVVGWVDRFATWRTDLAKRLAAGQDVAVELLVGADLVRTAARRATGEERALLRRAAATLRGGGGDAVAAAEDPALAESMARHPDRRHATTFDPALTIEVDRRRAGFAAWYEVFPRSTAPASDAEAEGHGGTPRHGTFADLQARLPAIADMGFDVVYLPPIHPIGRSFRKGPNNAENSGPDDPGSPWAIGAGRGGHDAIHPDLGTFRDLARLLTAAHALDLDVALDLALQASPDHPWVREHPEWFAHRPDGSIRYAENPPKKYQDIYPLDFTTDAWESLWDEILRIVRFWIARGIRTFRVDNPHTKPFAFWEWLIAAIRSDHPDTIFLAEAFTRPKVMKRLAKVGFTQSYTYFAWRTTKNELTDYLMELTTTDMVEYFRPSLWPNTPDILTAYLVEGGRAAFVARLILAATMSPLYGIYGPAFELMERAPREPGSEEYLHSEKYELRSWPIGRRGSLAPLIGIVNRVRRENPALHDLRNLRFSGTDNDAIVCYHKASADRSNAILVLVNLDPAHRQSCFTDLWLEELGLEPGEPFVVHDLMTGKRFRWEGRRNYVELDPAKLPAHVFRIERQAVQGDTGGDGPA
jgi:starch synthase (maltosyl-transferring)